MTNRVLRLMALLSLFALVSGLAVASEQPAGISGSVTGPDGKPLAGAQVWLIHPIDPVSVSDVITKQDGRFLFDPAEGESFMVYVLGPEGAPSTHKGVQPGEELSVALIPGSGCSVRVLDHRSGKPVPGATLRISDPFTRHLGPDARLIGPKREEGVGEAGARRHPEDLRPFHPTPRPRRPPHVSDR